jgi:large subunit ribosomal protein L16
MLSSKQVPLEFQTKPKKYKKAHKIKPKSSFSSVSCNNYSGLHVFCGLDTAYLTVKQMQAVLKIIKPQMKRIGKRCKVMITPIMDTILTKKPKDIRMGRGKGLPTERVGVYRGGHVVFGLSGLTEKEANKIYSLCSPKFAVPAKIIQINK